MVFPPGTIARAMPDSWHWPERMAARMVNEPSVLDAGIRLIRSQNQRAWDAMLEVAKIERENRAEIQSCKAKAAKQRAPVVCSVKIGG